MKALRLRAEFVSGAGKSKRSPEASRHWKNPEMSIESVPEPKPGLGELLLQVAFCGLCGSDYHLAEARPGDKSIYYPGLAELPVTLGHEFSGIVAGHGSGMSDIAKKLFPVGTLVTAEEMLWCGECEFCRAGHLNHCENLEELGFTRDGAHAEFVKVNSKYCWSLESMRARFGERDALRLGALVEPYSVSYRALFQGAHGGKWLPGDTVLIFGAGPIGLAALDLALTAGAGEVHVLETAPERRAFALEFGASKALPPEQVDRLDKYDWIIDAAGTPLAAQSSARHLKIGGSLCLLARTDEPCEIEPERLITTNSRIYGSQGHSGESAFPRIIALMAAGKLKALRLIREEIDLDAAAEKLRRQEKTAGKILVCPGGRK